MAIARNKKIDLINIRPDLCFLYNLKKIIGSKKDVEVFYRLVNSSEYQSTK